MAKAKQEKTQIDKDVEAALAILNKTFGEGTALTFDSTYVQNVDVISTGSLNLDVQLGVGGLPLGRVNTIYGESSSGKQLLLFNCVQKLRKRIYSCLSR